MENIPVFLNKIFLNFEQSYSLKNNFNSKQSSNYIILCII